MQEEAKEKEKEKTEVEEEEEEFKSIRSFVPNDFAINTIVRLYRINSVVT